MERVVDLISGTVGRSASFRRSAIAVWQTLGVCLTYAFAFQLHHDGSVPIEVRTFFWHTLPLLIMLCLLVFSLFRLHAGLWHYFSLHDLVRTTVAVFVAMVAFTITVLAMHGWRLEGVPVAILVLEFMFLPVWLGGWPLVVRRIRQNGQRNSSATPGDGADRVLVVSRLADADLIVRVTSGANIGHTVGIVTEEESASNTSLHGTEIFHAALSEIGSVARKTDADCILILPPFNRPRQMREIVESCVREDVPCIFRTIPSLSELASGELIASSIRNIDISDLIDREPTELDRTEVRRFLKRQSVMITGAGGSIGREICRQVARYEVSTIILFESSEFALYSIDQDLRHEFPNLNIIPCAGDIRHAEEIEAAIDAAGGVDIIYHAAAYKHVPLMEENVPACFRTNVLGTARLAEVAVNRGVDRFVMISSDKAVRPTSVMGATKRLAERVISDRSMGTTTFVSVRFGNVVESSGSVIPLFKRQIANGGPVTVTGPEVRRFFMTINEAVDLVLMAGTVGRNLEIMVLEMGESVKIVDLARRLIELSGLVPGKDIEIKFVGLRPGEKRYEEIMTADENVVRTSHDRIWVLKRNGTETEQPTIDLEKVEELVLADDTDALLALVDNYVPENRLVRTRGEQASVPLRARA